MYLLLHGKNLPQISLLATGGTIASRIDYATGGVVMASFLIGYAETFTATYLGSHWVMLVPLAAILGILAVKPSGIICAQMLTPFSTEVILETEELEPGEYTVDVNGGEVTTTFTIS